MIVPGHVVFLWRIIHQHFTLAFLEHISACHRNKPSWPFWKKLPTLAKNLQFTLNCPVFFWRDLSDAPPTRVPLFWFIWAAANPGGFLSPNSLFIQRDARIWKGQLFPFFLFLLMTLAISQVVFCVWLVRFYADSTTWTSNRRSSHIPPCSPCSRSLKLPWQKEEGVIRLISGQSKPRSAHSCAIMLLIYIFWMLRKHGNGYLEAEYSTF